MKKYILVFFSIILLSACGMQNNTTKVDNVEVKKDSVKVDNVEVNNNTTKAGDLEVKNNPEANEALKVVDEILGE